MKTCIFYKTINFNVPNNSENLKIKLIMEKKATDSHWIQNILKLSPSNIGLRSIIYYY